MNPEQARQTIGETFCQEFNDARFLYFIRNLVNHLDESKRQTWTLKKAAFEDYVNHFTRLGTYTDPGGEKVDVLVIHLRKDTILVAKQRDAGADTSALEREIDESVYALYLPAPRLRQAGGLTPEEKALVQAAAK